MTTEKTTLTPIEKLEVIAEYFYLKSNNERDWCQQQIDWCNEHNIKDTKCFEIGKNRETAVGNAYHDMLEAIQLYK